MIIVDACLKYVIGPQNFNLETVKLQQLFHIVKTDISREDYLLIESYIRLAVHVVDDQYCYDVNVNVADVSLMVEAILNGATGVQLPH